MSVLRWFLGFLIVAIMAGLAIYKLPRTLALEGATDADMLRVVKDNVKGLRLGQTVDITISSGGGPLITSLEIARILREASDRGVKVSVRAEGLCASGCTFVLAAGSPGERSVTRDALILVHPIQQGSMFSPPVCVSRVEDPKTQDDYVTNIMYYLMVNAYTKYTGKPYNTVNEWLKCGKERVGSGAMAVQMGLADKVV